MYPIGLGDTWILIGFAPNSLRHWLTPMFPLAGIMVLLHLVHMIKFETEFMKIQGT